MPKLIFTQEEIDKYSKGPDIYHFHKECCEAIEKMEVHADGIYPKCLIEERRPNEPEEVKCYREKIWEPITKPIFSKIFSSLQKIRRSSDWIIKYPQEDEFSKINEDETLEKYCETKFPFFTSVTNWVFEALLRRYLIDPNGVVAVIPMEETDGGNEYLKPVTMIFPSNCIIDYRAEDYAVLKDPESESWYIFTTQSMYRYDRLEKSTVLGLTYDHKLGELPVSKWRGSLVCHSGHNLFYESRISAIVPELNEAIREYSDLQAAKVLHTYPERWEYTNNECVACQGSKIRPNPAYTGPNCGCEATTACTTCNGLGYIATGPYSKIMVRPSNAGMGEVGIPTPPAGYVEKDVEIVKLQETSVEAHKYKALAAINFEFLAQTPLSQSGTAKAMDHDEANNTGHSIAEDLVSFMDWLYNIIALYRYKEQYPDVTDMLPYIAVPEKFDLVSAAAIGEELKAAKEAKANPIIINAMEQDYTAKKFAHEPGLKDLIGLTLLLDPLAGVTEDDKMTRLSNNGISQLTYVISSNIQEFVQDAIDQDKTFAEKPLKAQKEVIKKMGEEVLNPIEKQVLDAANNIGNNQVDQSVSTDNTGQPTGNPGGTTQATKAA